MKVIKGPWISQEKPKRQPSGSDKAQALVGQVASISLPVGVKELAGMVDDLEKKHGKGLVMRKIGNALIISKPNATDEALRK